MDPILVLLFPVPLAVAFAIAFPLAVGGGGGGGGKPWTHVVPPPKYLARIIGSTVPARIIWLARESLALIWLACPSWRANQLGHD